MIRCTIRGCDEFASEIFTDKALLARWIIVRACRCGAYDLKQHKSCTCKSEGPVPISYWPNLDWWAFGGVEEVVLCPNHRREVASEIAGQRLDDPSMNSEKQNRGNVH